MAGHSITETKVAQGVRHRPGAQEQPLGTRSRWSENDVSIVRKRSASRSRLLDLPPEIRTIIYRQAGFPFHPHSACKKRSIRLSIYRARQKPSRVVHSAFQAAIHRPLSEHERKLRRRRRDCNGVGVLSTCKQICAEATEALYSQTIFSFLSLEILQDFLRTIGTNRRHLRHLVVDGYFQQSLDTSALRLLQEAKGLRNFKLSFEIAQWDVDAMARLFANLVAQLQVSYQQSGQRDSALDVLQFVHYHDKYRAPEGRIDCPVCQEARQVQTEVRQALQCLTLA